MPVPLQPKPGFAVTIAVSSRTLFNMVAERLIYEKEGVENYVAYQVEHENEPLKPGPAFPFVKVSWQVFDSKPLQGTCLQGVVLAMLHLVSQYCIHTGRATFKRNPLCDAGQLPSAI